MGASDAIKEAKALEKIEKLKEQIAEADGAAKDRLEDKLELQEALLEKLRRAEGYHSRSVEDATALLGIYETQNKTLKGGIVYREQAIETNERRLRQSEEMVKNGTRTLEQHEAEEKKLEKANGLLRAKNKLAAEFATTQKESNELASDFGDSLGKAATVYQTSFGADKIKNLAKAFAGGTASLAEFGASLVTSFSDSVLTNMVGVVLQAYDAENAFRKATGASEEMARSMTDVYEGVRETGASMEQVTAAGQTLYGTYTDFTMVSKDMQKSLTATAATLEMLGVSNADFAKGVQVSTKMLGQSATEAEATARELTTFAKELGVAPSEMAARFAEAGPAMAKYGAQGVKAFKDLAHISKITGMEISKVLSITDKFDTFEGAADQAGQLNAALGGNFVNAMDLMMTTDPGERFNMIRDSILDAGLSFDDMSYYQKNFYKDALGLSDVGDLAMMLSGDMSDLAGATDESAESLIEQKKAAQEVQSLQTQLKALMASMVPIMTPLIDGLRWMTKHMGFMKPLLQIIIYLFIAYKAAVIASTVAQTAWAAAVAIWTGIVGAYNAVKAIAIALTSGGIAKTVTDTAVRIKNAIATKFQAAATDELNESTEEGEGPMESLGESAGKAAKGLLAVGLAAMMIGMGIGLAAMGLAQMVAAFKGLGDAAWPAAAAVIGFTVAFGLLMLGLVALVLGPQAAVTALAVGVLLAVGAAALMMGAGIALAAVGFAQFLGAFSGFDPAGMLGVVMAMGPLALATMLLGNPIALLGIMNLVLLAGAIALIGQFGGGFEQFLGAFNAVDPLVIWGTAAALGALGLALTIFGNPFVILGIMNIGLLAAAIALVGGGPIAGFNEFLGTLSAIDPIAAMSTAAALGALGLATLLFGSPLATFGIMNLLLLSSAFTLLGASIALIGMAAAESFERISEAVNNMPTAKTVIVTGLMAATAAAAAVTMPAQMIAAALGGGAGGFEGGIGGGGGGGATQTVRQPIHLTIDGEPLKKYVLEIIGTDIREVNFG